MIVSNKNIAFEVARYGYCAEHALTILNDTRSDEYEIITKEYFNALVKSTISEIEEIFK